LVIQRDEMVAGYFPTFLIVAWRVPPDLWSMNWQNRAYPFSWLTLAIPRQNHSVVSAQDRSFDRPMSAGKLRETQV
jgi:hypothetical protein